MAPLISFPPAATIKILNRSNWPSWSVHILTLLQMNGLQLHVTGTKPTSNLNWDAVEEMLLGILEMYCQKNVWNAVLDDTTFDT
jgi:hypothetical protein